MLMYDFISPVMYGNEYQLCGLYTYSELTCVHWTDLFPEEQGKLSLDDFLC